MSRRVIVTSQPDVACEVCERRLLRGEHPEVFIASGKPRIVCELCAPRAAHAGWLRETDAGDLLMPPARGQRGRNMFERLRPRRRPGRGAAAGVSGERRGATFVSAGEVRSAAEGARAEALPGARASVREPVAGANVQEPAARDGAGVHAEALVAQARSSTGVVAGTASSRTYAPDVLAPNAPASPSPLAGAPASEERSQAAADEAAQIERALTVFNSSEQPRRIAGLARSLGEPMVNARLLEGIPNVVSIVVAWELCWYRYRVDFDEQPLGARVVAQGSELSELEREEQPANALADEHGALAVAA